MKNIILMSILLTVFSSCGHMMGHKGCAHHGSKMEECSGCGKKADEKCDDCKKQEAKAAEAKKTEECDDCKKAGK